MAEHIYHCYSVDASVMIDLKDNFPEDIFQPAWDEIARLVSLDRWKIFESAADEMSDEMLQKWLKGNNSAIVTWNPQFNEYMNSLMADLQKNNMMLVDPGSTKNNADPFVIALGFYLEQRNPNTLKRIYEDRICCVLTNEVARPHKINIPSICNYYDLPYMNSFDLMRYHQWNISVSVENP